MLATRRVFLRGRGAVGRLMLVLLCFVWLSMCIFTPASSPLHHPPPTSMPRNLWGARVANGRGAGAGTLGSSASLASPPPLPPSCSVTGSDGHLPGCVASLSVSSCSDPLAGWLRKMCFRRPVVLGTEGIQPSPFWCVLPILSRFLLLWLPVGCW